MAAEGENETARLIGGIVAFVFILWLTDGCGACDDGSQVTSEATTPSVTRAECDTKAAEVIRICRTQGEPACTEASNAVLYGPCGSL